MDGRAGAGGRLGGLLQGSRDVWSRGIDTRGLWSKRDGGYAGCTGRAQGCGGPGGRGDGAHSGGCVGPQGEKEDRQADIEHMDSLRQTGNQINDRSGRDGRMQDRRLMRAARPGRKTTACGADWSACLALGNMPSVQQDGGGRRRPKRGPEYEQRPSAPEGTPASSGYPPTCAAAPRLPAPLLSPDCPAPLLAPLLPRPPPPSPVPPSPAASSPPPLPSPMPS